MRCNRLIVSTLAATAAVLATMTADAYAGCLRPQSTATKTLLPGRIDRTSFFTLTSGRAVIEVDLRTIPDRCRRNGIEFEMISGQTGNTINCAGPDSDEGPGAYLRCRVAVDGGRYFVRVRNPTACTVAYRNICRND